MSLPRPVWKGHLKISLVAVPVRLHEAVHRGRRVELHLVHRGCGQRVHYQAVCPRHGPVPREELVRAYEYERDRYLELDEEELAAIRLETSRVIEVEGFVPAGSVDPLYLDTPYFLAPDGPVAAQPFAVLREAMARAGVQGWGRVVLAGHERGVLLGPRGPGMLLTTLRQAWQVQAEEALWAELEEARVPAAELRLAREVVDALRRELPVEGLRDRYEEALLELIRAKLEGRRAELPAEAEEARVVDFMEALRRSAEQAR
ncbi:MAG: Ku protein, partial [Gammaproteobacteria bacterium]